MTQFAVLALLGTIWIQSTRDGKCGDWKEAVQIGELPGAIDEASGVAVSRRFPRRMYHVNDSGDSGRLFVTDLTGENLQTIHIENFKPKDVEALSVGPCGNNSTCIFIADIGDNDRNRKSMEIVVIEEPAEIKSSVSIKRRIKLRYPGAPHDAEGLAVHPDGTIYLLTKSIAPRLFKLNRRLWESGNEKIQVLEPVIGLRPGGLPTDLSISDDGTRFLVLTYTGAVEFDQKFRARSIPLRFLPQQEAVTYLPGSRSFIYTTERSAGPAWIMRSDLVSCGR